MSLLDSLFVGALLVGMIGIEAVSAWVLVVSIKDGDLVSSLIWAAVFVAISILNAWAFWELILR